MEQPIISGVAADINDAKITVVGVPDKPGEAAAIFRALADAKINVDMIVQNVSAAATGRTDVTFTCPQGSVQQAMAALSGGLKKATGNLNTGYDAADRLIDPYEMASVANDPAYAQVKAALWAEWNVLKDCAGPSCQVPSAVIPAPRK